MKNWNNSSITNSSMRLFPILFLLGSCHLFIPQRALEIPLLKVGSVTAKSKSKKVIESTYHVRVFFSPTCPICRSVVVEIIELRQKFKIQQLDIALVLPPTCLSDTALLLQQFAYIPDIHFLVDTKFELARKLKATTTPQAFLLNEQSEILYQGALNNYYKNVGVHGSAITKRYLQEALIAILNSKEYTRKTDAIGCYIEYQ